MNSDQSIPSPISHDEYENTTLDAAMRQNIEQSRATLQRLELAYENMPAVLRTMTRKQASEYQFYL